MQVAEADTVLKGRPIMNEQTANEPHTIRDMNTVVFCMFNHMTRSLHEVPAETLCARNHVRSLLSPVPTQADMRSCLKALRATCRRNKALHDDVRFDEAVVPSMQAYVNSDYGSFKRTQRAAASDDHFRKMRNAVSTTVSGMLSRPPVRDSVKSIRISSRSKCIFMTIVESITHACCTTGFPRLRKLCPMEFYCVKEGCAFLHACRGGSLLLPELRDLEFHLKNVWTNEREEVDTSALVPFLSQLTSLTRLKLVVQFYPSAAKIGGIGALTDLRELDIDARTSTDFAELSVLTRLTCLKLDGVSFSADSLTGLTNLKHIFVRPVHLYNGKMVITGDCRAALSALPGLENVDCSHFVPDLSALSRVTSLTVHKTMLPSPAEWLHADLVPLLKHLKLDGVEKLESLAGTFIESLCFRADGLRTLLLKGMSNMGSLFTGRRDCTQHLTGRGSGLTRLQIEPIGVLRDVWGLGALTALTSLVIKSIPFERFTVCSSLAAELSGLYNQFVIKFDKVR
jgi:hypothetical protein